MDWKRFYRSELENPGLLARLREDLDGDGSPDHPVERVCREGGILSFPHTSLHQSGDLTCRVVRALRRTGVERVIALGVLHGGTLPPPHREAFQEYGSLAGVDDGIPRARGIFDALGGAFLGSPSLETPLGRLPAWSPGDLGDLLRPAGSLLDREFSLDGFLALLALEADLRGVPAPSVLPLYVGLTRDPDGTWETARRLGRGLRALAGPGVAVVATGDLVHYGHGYSGAGEMAGRAVDPRRLMDGFRPRIEEALRASLDSGDHDGFLGIAERELRNDQRNLFPVAAETAGRGAILDWIDARFTDYADILEVARPSLVAAVLYGIRPGAATRPS